MGIPGSPNGRWVWGREPFHFLCFPQPFAGKIRTESQCGHSALKGITLLKPERKMYFFIPESISGGYPTNAQPLVANKKRW